MNERDFSGKAKVTFGIRVPNSGPLASPESIVQVAREAESLGYDSIWVHDHLTWTLGVKYLKNKKWTPVCLQNVSMEGILPGFLSSTARAVFSLALIFRQLIVRFRFRLDWFVHGLSVALFL